MFTREYFHQLEERQQKIALFDLPTNTKITLAVILTECPFKKEEPVWQFGDAHHCRVRMWTKDDLSTLTMSSLDSSPCPDFKKHLLSRHLLHLIVQNAVLIHREDALSVPEVKIRLNASSSIIKC